MSHVSGACDCHEFQRCHETGEQERSAAGLCGPNQAMLLAPGKTSIDVVEFFLMCQVAPTTKRTSNDP